MFYPYFINKYIYIYLHTINNIVAGLFSLCVSQGGGHFKTQLPCYVNIVGVGTVYWWHPGHWRFP